MKQSLSDNPLVCSCELIWFPNLLKELKNRDDEMTQKKRPMCTMLNEHREYFVQNMPLERMNCIGKNLGRSAMSGQTSIYQQTVYNNGIKLLTSGVMTVCMKNMFRV